MCRCDYNEVTKALGAAPRPVVGRWLWLPNAHAERVLFFACCSRHCVLTIVSTLRPDRHVTTGSLMRPGRSCVYARELIYPGTFTTLHHIYIRPAPPNTDSLLGRRSFPKKTVSNENRRRAATDAPWREEPGIQIMAAREKTEKNKFTPKEAAEADRSQRSAVQPKAV